MRRLKRGDLSSVSPAFVAAALAVFFLLQTGSVADDSAKPAKKDSSAGFKPAAATLTTAIEPPEAKAGDVVTFKVTATVKPGYHIYKYAKTKSPGPVPTMFDFFDPDGLEIQGDWAASREAEKHKDPNFKEVEFVEYYEGEVTWSIKLKVPTGTVPAEKKLRVQARYMVCDAKTCSIDGKWTLPAAQLKVSSGGAAASPAVAAIDKKPEQVSKEPVKQEAGAASAVLGAARKDEAPGPDATKAAAAATTSPTEEAAGGSAIQSEIAEKAQAGLIPFLIASAIGGLFALVMPCVWPMVPITVNFFIKQGQGPSGRSKGTWLAFMYCLSIIAVFTAVGVLFAFFFSAGALQNLANNPWLNLFVAALFLVFGLSLLGLFELSLPSFLLNASSQNESRGGLIGVFFMALTLTITSFTCTFPVVGGLLVMAAGGNFFYPIVGLATFASVIAFPFLLLALSPGLISKMPRSGDWMNAVKMVGGLVEIGAALKFINTAELAFVVPEEAWFDAQVILTCWIALSVVCGFYLLGIFRTDHDHGDVKVGTGRVMFGTLFLGMAIYMAPALFGRPPQSLVWDRLILGILPPDAREFSANLQLAGGAGGGSDVKATSTDPALAVKEEKKFHGVLWGMSFDQARELAAAEKKPILIDFTGVNCSNCRLMEGTVLPKPNVVSVLKKFVTIQLYTDFVNIASITADQREELAEANKDLLVKLRQAPINPLYVVLSPDGKVLGSLGGYIEAPVFIDFLTKAISKLPPATKVASADGVAAED